MTEEMGTYLHEDAKSEEALRKCLMAASKSRQIYVLDRKDASQLFKIQTKG
jgi:glucose dehydrogenase